MKVSPARLAAFEILQRIDADEGLSSDLLPKYEAELKEVDRRLCHSIVLGVLRRQIYLDRLIDEFSGNKKIDIEVRISLRIGLFQLIDQDRIPAFSAVNESVELVRVAKKRSASGFVNAILRRASRSIPELKYHDEIDRLSVETSHPRSMIERWIGEFGFDEAKKLAEIHNVIPPVSYRRTANEFGPARTLPEARPGELSPNANITERITDELRTLEADGLIYFQDEGSMMVAEIAAAYIRNSFLDVCASPGSKSTAIAATRKDVSHFVAGDLSERRTAVLIDNIHRQGAEIVHVVRHDAENGLPYEDQVFDTVLVDAPCSGTGTIRHNPEIRYRFDANDLDRYSRKQLRMLKSASEKVSIGGVLIYSTCSLEREENEDVVRDFLTGTTSFDVEAVSTADRFLQADGTARLYPQRDGSDGFFVAVFRRR